MNFGSKFKLRFFAHFATWAAQILHTKVFGDGESIPAISFAARVTQVAGLVPLGRFEGQVGHRFLEVHTRLYLASQNFVYRGFLGP